MTHDSDTVNVDRTDFGTFIHSELDDAGLSPYAFRIYCHLARRANMTGKAWPGKESMAAICGLGRTSVLKALTELEERKMLIIQRNSRPDGGQGSNTYFLTGKAKWTPPPAATRPPPGREATAPRPPRDRPPGRHAAAKVFQEEGNPQKEIQKKPPTPIDPQTNLKNSEQFFEGNEEQGGKPDGQEKADLAILPTQELFLELEPMTPSGPTPEELIYAGYPRKVGKPAALKAIKTALKKLPFAELQKAVEDYAATTKGKAPEFIPHPATWFNQDRWNDTPHLTTSQKHAKELAAKLW